MNNKWMKWIVGIGGISTFTLFLQSMSADEETLKNNQGYVVNENENLLNVQGTLATNPVDREKQLVALDWEEDNWDVEYSNEVIISTPKSQTPYLDRAEQRTRRS